MAGLSMLFKMFALYSVLALYACGPRGAMAAPHQIQKRDIFSDIGNFFDSLEMQVDMTIFQPIANFFTEAVADFENYVVLPAEQFFMQANTVIVAGLYDIGMLVEDIGHAIESDIISDVVSIENLAQQVANTVVSDAETVFGDIKSEFDNVITPALTQVGQEIGAGLNTAGQDILQGLEVAGQYIEDHPELIAEVLLTVALTAVTIVQPEFAAGDAALIGDIATEAASGVAGEFLGGLASDAVDVGADFVLDDGAEEVVMEADMTLFEQISGSLDKYTGYIDNVGKILNFVNDANTTLGDIASLAPVTQQTITDIQNAINPLAAASAEVGGAYSNIQNVIDYLNKAGKIVAIVARDDHEIEARAQKKPTTSTSVKSTTSSTKLSTLSSFKTTTASTKSFTSTKASILSSVKPTISSSLTSKTQVVSSTRSSTASPSATLAAPPSSLLTQYVHHHFLNSTKASKSLVKMNLKRAVRAHLGQTNMTSAAGYMPYVSTALNNKNMTVTYPPTASSHLMAISHQIATGNATAYNSKNTTVKIQMDANAPKDICLGVPKVPCFGNQAGNPYCLHQCASRWYNQMNITPLHY